MTTDRELLELAAKAAGLYAEWPAPDYGVEWNGQGLWCFGNGEGVLWSPLADDGDRYRLAKALNMNIEFDTCTVGAKLPNGNWMWIGWSEKDLKGLHKTDAEAILALAAEIGRQMP